MDIDDIQLNLDVIGGGDRNVNVQKESQKQKYLEKIAQQKMIKSERNSYVQRLTDNITSNNKSQVLEKTEATKHHRSLDNPSYNSNNQSGIQSSGLNSTVVGNNSDEFQIGSNKIIEETKRNFGNSQTEIKQTSVFGHEDGVFQQSFKPSDAAQMDIQGHQQGAYNQNQFNQKRQRPTLDNRKDFINQINNIDEILGVEDAQQQMDEQYHLRTLQNRPVVELSDRQISDLVFNVDGFEEELQGVNLLKKPNQDKIAEEAAGNTNSKGQAQPAPQQSFLFTMEQFSDVPDLNPKIKSSLAENDFQVMTNIQQTAIVNILANPEKNIVIRSETGSGQTLAYMIPIINELLQQEIKRTDGSYVFVICPTRELCIQCQEIATKITQRSAYIVIGTLVGGQNPQKEKARLRKGVTMLIATPGRLQYHIKNTESFDFKKLKAIVFEESDSLLDMGFRKTLEDIIDNLCTKVDFQQVRQILVAANYSEKIESLYLQMTKQKCLFLGFKQNLGISEAATDVMEAVNLEEIPIEAQMQIPQSLKQTYTLVSEEKRIPFLISYIKLLKDQQIILFVATIDEVEFFFYMLQTLTYKDGQGNVGTEQVIEHRLFKLHGNIDQKERSDTYFKYKKCEEGAILICTDVASRGLDFYEVTHSIIFDVPNSIVEYCNSIGRTARMGQKGVSILILNNQEEEYADLLKENDIHLTLLEGDSIIDGFKQHLKNKLDINMKCVPYVLSLVKNIIKDDNEKYYMARRAFISSMRAYSRMSNQQIFTLKRLNLRNIARNFGLTNVKGQKDTQKQEYQTQLQESHKNQNIGANIEREAMIRKTNRKVFDPRKISALEFG